MCVIRARCSSLVRSCIRAKNDPSFVRVIEIKSSGENPGNVRMAIRILSFVPSGTESSISVPPVNSMERRGPGVIRSTSDTRTSNPEIGAKILEALANDMGVQRTFYGERKSNHFLQKQEIWLLWRGSSQSQKSIKKCIHKMNEGYWRAQKLAAKTHAAYNVWICLA